MYKSINDAHTALVNSGVFEMFDFDVIIIDNVVGYMWMNDKSPHAAAVHFGVADLIPIGKDDNWFEVVSTNDGEIYGVMAYVNACEGVSNDQLPNVAGGDTGLTPTRKDDNWNDGTTTIWFEDVSTNDGEILGVVFEGCSDPMLVDLNGESVDNPAILGSIIEAARAAVVNL